MKEESVFIRLWAYLKHYKFTLFLAIFLKILSAVANVLEPFILGLVITELTQNLLDMAHQVPGASINYTYIFWVLVIYSIRALFYEIGSYGSTFYITRTVQHTIRDLRNDLSEKINRIPVSYFDKHLFGDMLGRFTSDVETVSNALQQSFLQIVNAIISLTLVISMVLYLNLQLAMVVIVSIPITYFAAQSILKKSQPYFKRQANVLGDMNGFVQENLTGFNILKLYGREEASAKEFAKITDELQDVGFKASFMSGIMMPILHGISDMTYLIVALLG